MEVSHKRVITISQGFMKKIDQLLILLSNFKEDLGLSHDAVTTFGNKRHML